MSSRRPPDAGRAVGPPATAPDRPRPRGGASATTSTCSSRWPDTRSTPAMWSSARPHGCSAATRHTRATSTPSRATRRRWSPNCSTAATWPLGGTHHVTHGRHRRTRPRGARPARHPRPDRPLDPPAPPAPPHRSRLMNAPHPGGSPRAPAATPPGRPPGRSATAAHRHLVRPSRTHRQHCPACSAVIRIPDPPGSRRQTIPRRRLPAPSNTASTTPCSNTSCSTCARPRSAPYDQPHTHHRQTTVDQRHPRRRRCGDAGLTRDHRPATRRRLPPLARPSRGHRRLRRTHPPPRLLPRPRPRRRRAARARAGTVLAPCGNRRASVCPACSDRYAADAFHLLRAGLAGDDTKNVPDHRRPTTRGCSSPSPRPPSGRSTPAPSPRAGTSSRAAAASDTAPTTRASAPRSTRTATTTTGAVLWQAHAGKLWARFTIALRRALAAALGVNGRRVPRARPPLLRQGRRVPTPRARALPRRHPPRRPRRTRRPTTGRARPARAARRDHHRRPRAQPDHASARRHPAAARLGRATGPPGGHPGRAAQIEDDDREITDAALAAYIAKYATKGTGATEGADRPIRDVAHVEHLRICEHHRRMITTAWELGGLARLRRAQPAPVGAHARLPRALPHQEPPVLGDLQSTARAAPDLAAALRPRPTRHPTPTTPTRSRPTWTPSP